MGAALIAGTSASAQENTLGFDVPPSLNVPPGNTLHIHAFGRGFQVYTWNGATWGAATPEAMLVDAEGNLVSIHFGGPSWASADGSGSRSNQAFRQAWTTPDSLAQAGAPLSLLEPLFPIAWLAFVVHHRQNEDEVGFYSI